LGEKETDSRGGRPLEGRVTRQRTTARSYRAGEGRGKGEFDGAICVCLSPRGGGKERGVSATISLLLLRDKTAKTRTINFSPEIGDTGEKQY